MADAKKEFVAVDKFWLGTNLIEKDQIVKMTDAEAEYYVPHILKPKAAAKTAPKSRD